MRIVLKYESSNPKKMNVYQYQDLEDLKPVLEKSSELWTETWKNQGSQDHVTSANSFQFK